MVCVMRHKKNAVVTFVYIYFYRNPYVVVDLLDSEILIVYCSIAVYTTVPETQWAS